MTFLVSIHKCINLFRKILYVLAVTLFCQQMSFSQTANEPSSLHRFSDLKQVSEELEDSMKGKSPPKIDLEALRRNRVIDREMSEWRAMRTAIRHPEQMITYGLPESDIQIIKNARDNLDSIRDRSNSLLDDTCLKYLNGYFQTDQSINELANLYSLGDKYERDDMVSLYNSVLSRLSEEGQVALNEFKEQVIYGVSQNTNNWGEIANKDAESLRKNTELVCSKRGTP